jgi:hypothetical protein
MAPVCDGSGIPELLETGTEELELLLSDELDVPPLGPEELDTGTLEDEERSYSGGQVLLGSSQSLQEVPPGKHSPII